MQVDIDRYIYIHISWIATPSLSIAVTLVGGLAFVSKAARMLMSPQLREEQKWDAPVWMFTRGTKL